MRNRLLKVVCMRILKDKILNDMNELAKQIHENAVKHGFYDNKREIGTLLMLCVSELSEALEADRKNRFAKLDSFYRKRNFRNPNSDTPEERSFQADFEACVKDSFEDEIADTVIRILDLCGYLSINIDEHIRLKMEYNSSRKKMHGKKY